MTQIDLIVPTRPRLWQKRLIERLEAGGHEVVTSTSPGAGWPAAMDFILAVERRLLRRADSLGAPADILPRLGSRRAALRIDLAGDVAGGSTPTIQIALDGSFASSAIVTALAAGRLPEVEIVLDGVSFDRAAPMVDNRAIVAAGLDDVLARIVTLTLRAVNRFEHGERQGAPFVARPVTTSVTSAYLGSALPRLAGELWRRSRYRYAHWRVGYRLGAGPGIAESGTIGNGWSVLPDDGSRFYADPFPVERDGEHLIFVEDYPHATGKAVISVARIDAHGVASAPAPVLEQPHHLSYPQVFEHDGVTWMLPEGGGSGRLTLYRAERFPDRWVPAAVLIEGELSDATLLRHGGNFWLFATDRDGVGSTSDTLVVFHAPTLLGPWSAHKRNPILIDRRRARPGGAFVQTAGGIVLPVQDGTSGYGGGLGLSALVRLDEDQVELATPSPIGGAGDFPYPRIHTLNRAGRLEVIDGIAAVRRR